MHHSISLTRNLCGTDPFYFLQKCANTLARGLMLAGLSYAASVSAATVSYKSVLVDGVSVAYREAGPLDRPTILLLHGVPSSSRMYDAMMRKIGSRYHVVALDYPGFGNSDAPDVRTFSYTFDHLSEVVERFTDVLGISRYVLFMQDYGAPIGMRIALARPNAVAALIFQNGNVYEQGLGPIWQQRRLYWADRDKYENEIRAGQQSLDVLKQRHLGDDPNVPAYDPDLWNDESGFLQRPGEAEIQAALIYDYRNNVEAYPKWQQWLKTKQLPTLVIWGKHDLAFTVAGALAFERNLPAAEIVILDAGHFAMDTQLDAVVSVTERFLHKNAPKL